jgi:ElaB/YqjD/DUF883 family membrane-anchored ribosome-binding protein
MASEAQERDYSEDEIEQILGVGGYEAKLMLKEICVTIQDNPLLVAALIFAMGILVGATLNRGHRKSWHPSGLRYVLIRVGQVHLSASDLAKSKDAEEIKVVEEDFRALRRDIDARYGELRAQVKDLQQKVTKTVSERPLLALGIAFVVGMAIGVALSGSKD